jgi:Flp pilus assembly protein TadD
MVRRLLPLALALAAAAGCASDAPVLDAAGIARAYAEAGRYAEAAREIELAVRARPEDVLVRRQAAAIQAEAGDLARAVDHLEVAIRLAPSDPESWIALGELETRRRNPPDAYVAFRRASALAPEDVRAVSGLAIAADSLGFDEEADLAYARWAALERERDPATPPPKRQ